MTTRDVSALDPVERERAYTETKTSTYYADSLLRSKSFREDYLSKLNVVKWKDMPFERSPDGLIKHIINEELDTKECCIDSYMQFIPPGKASGIHRHLSEEIVFVVEGRGYDLHWDVKFECKEAFNWEWEQEPKKFEWQQGDFVYIPPYCSHQHFNTDPNAEARIIVINSRIVKAMGFDWFDQIAPAEGY